MSEPETQWLDIAPFLKAVSDGLSLGEMVEAEDFSLNQTMSAVAIGAPKMDPGMTKQCNAPELIEQGLAPLELSPECIIGVMDELFIQEAGYHRGASVGQTVYTCLYMHDLERLKNTPFLSAFCHCMRATSRLIRNIVLMACVCEEEDFNILCSGVPLENHTGNPEVDVASLLDEVENSLSQMAKVKVGQLQAGGSLPSVLARALLSRLRMQKYLYLGLDRVMKKNKPDLVQASRYFAAGHTELETIRNTRKLGQPLPLAFESGLDRSAAPGGLVRVYKPLSSEEAWEHFEELFTQLQTCCSITAVGSYKDLKAFLLSFVKKCGSPISRSVLHIQLDNRKGVVLNELPRWCPSRRMLSEAVNLPHQNGAISPEADVFFEQAFIGVQNWCQCMCLNRSRQRRRLKKGLEDWRNLLDHALAADNSEGLISHMRDTKWQWPSLSLQHSVRAITGPLTAWIERECCSSMMLHLLLGCELDLYNGNELLMIFWYCEYLYRKLMNITRELFTARSGALPINQPTTQKKNKPQRKSKEKASEQANLVRAQKHSVEVGLLEMELHICQGLFRLLLGIKMLGVDQQPDAPLNTEAERFYHRFSPFGQIESPEPLSYQAFIANTDPIGTSVAKVEALMQVGNTNRIASRVLHSTANAGSTADGSGMKAKFSFEVHSYFPIVAITRGALKKS